jgi:hypothetical protein
VIRRALARLRKLVRLRGAGSDDARRLDEAKVDAIAGAGGGSEGFAPKGAFGYDDGRPRR